MINRVVISAEAVCDYEDCLSCGTLNRRKLSEELEEFLDWTSCGGYTRCKYLDEETGKMLMLFIYPIGSQGLFRNWIVMGICEADDWNEDVEYYGEIRNWVMSSITEFQDGDWVWRLRLWQEEQQRLINLAEKERL